MANGIFGLLSQAKEMGKEGVGIFPEDHVLARIIISGRLKSPIGQIRKS